LNKLLVVCKNCQHEILISSEEYLKISGIPLALSSINQVYQKFICSNCSKKKIYFFDDLNNIIFDPFKLIFCNHCKKPITNQRLEATNHQTNLCSAKCIENIIEIENNTHLDAAPGIPVGVGEKIPCPKCKSRLELRKGPTGWFLGCIKYPLCKGTSQL
tara:strand:+ start:237 stop:713 length:477 start_codon:yes stop_codon:yes gene_type:complete